MPFAPRLLLDSACDEFCETVFTRSFIIIAWQDLPRELTCVQKANLYTRSLGSQKHAQPCLARKAQHTTDAECSHMPTAAPVALLSFDDERGKAWEARDVHPSRHEVPVGSKIRSNFAQQHIKNICDVGWVFVIGCVYLHLLGEIM